MDELARPVWKRSMRRHVTIRTTKLWNRTKSLSLRAWCLIGTVGTLGAGVSLVLLAYVGVDFGLGTHNKSALVTAAVAFGAFLFAVVAAVLAMAAFWAASGTPELSVEVSFAFSAKNRPAFKVKQRVPGQNAWLIEPFKQIQARVVVWNSSQYSAKNPGVRLTMVGFFAVKRVAGWEPIRTANMVGVTQFQWDGGADQIIHGGWSRVLPAFSLEGAQINAAVPDHQIIVEVVADGIPPKTDVLDVRWLEPEAWDEYQAELNRKGVESSRVELESDSSA